MDARCRTLTADRGDAGRRLDLVIRRHLADVGAATRTRVQAWIEDGHVAVNGTRVCRASSRAALGDLVTVALPDAVTRLPMAAEAVDLDILYEDDHLLAVDKPAGIVVHPTYKNARGTLMNALLWQARGWAPDQRPSIVGRLDKLTSGIVIVAKTAAMHASLQRAMASSDSEKTYLAIVYGRVGVSSGVIDLRLNHQEGDRRRTVASPHRGAPSRTRFERLAQVAAPRVGLALVRCRLETGRRHQIRAHLAARGWPLVGDAMYGDPRWPEIEDPALADAVRQFPRQALHAWRTGLRHPVTGGWLQIDAPVPADLRALLAVSGLSRS
jgi:23S rRNA pseudouridine1911/1915/1917 synthase